MTQIAYTVIVSIRYQTKIDEWLEWMRGGHIDEVIKGGADSAEIVRLDPEHESQPEVIFEVRYKFKDRGTFETYLENHAPRLRREGLERFPLADGFHYKRSVGEII